MRFFCPIGGTRCQIGLNFGVEESIVDCCKFHPHEFSDVGCGAQNPWNLTKFLPNFGI